MAKNTKTKKKAGRILVMLLHEETGHFYMTSKATKPKFGTQKVAEKLALKKYNPTLRQHVIYKEKKMPSPKKN